MLDFELFKKIINLLKDNKMRYWIFGGYALDGIRGKLTRGHKDIDIYLDSRDIENFIELLSSLGYDCRQRERMYFVDAADLKIGILSLKKEGNYHVADGNCTLVKYPEGVFSKDIYGTIDGFEFRVAPREALVFDYQFSPNEADRKFASGLEVDRKLFDKIKSVKIRDRRS
jgi:hypothetical protein